jgi:hypothetical protein
MKTIINILTLIVFSLIFFSCKKDTKTNAPAPEPEAPANNGYFQLSFNAMVGDSDLVFNTETYTNAANNTFNVTMFKYYISNIKITNTDNSIWNEPNSYHLVDHSIPSSSIINITNVPLGNYKSIEFMIGVDSAQNAQGATGMTGALDPLNGMYWSWNNGYIAAKVEGTSPQSTATGNLITFHPGGFSGINKTMRIVNPTFNNDTLKITGLLTPKIIINSDLKQWFESPNTIDFSINPTIDMPGANAKKIADNYADMFSVSEIKNN